MLAPAVVPSKLDTFRLCPLDLATWMFFWLLSPKLAPSASFSVFFLLELKRDLLSWILLAGSTPGFKEGNRVDVKLRSCPSISGFSLAAFMGEL